MLTDIEEEDEMCLLAGNKEKKHSQSEDENDKKDGKLMEQGVAAHLLRVWSKLMVRRGVFYGTLLGISIGTNLCVVKGLSALSVYQIMFYRSILLLLPVIFVTWEKGNSYNIMDLVYYLAYGIFNSLGILLIYLALGLTQVGNVSAISTNGPVPTAIFGYIILQESITTYDIVLFTFNFIGIFLVSKPPVVFGSNRGNQVKSINEFYGALMAVLGLFSLVLTSIFSRKLAYRDNSDSALMTFIPRITGIAITGVILSFTNAWALPSTLEGMLLVLSVGILALLANLSVVLGLQTESVITIAVLETLSVPVAFLGDVLVFDNVPDLVSILGAVTILATSFACLFKP